MIAGDRPFKEDKGWSLLIDFEHKFKVLYDFIFNDKLPNVEEFDLFAVESIAAQYNAEEAAYNAIYNINPEDYDDRDKEPTEILIKIKRKERGRAPVNEGEENSTEENNNGSTPNNLEEIMRSQI